MSDFAYRLLYIYIYIPNWICFLLSNFWPVDRTIWQETLKHWDLNLNHDNIWQHMATVLKILDQKTFMKNHDTSMVCTSDFPHATGQCRGPPSRHRLGERSPASRPLAALPHAAGEPSADAAGPLRTPQAAARDSGRSGGTGQNRTTGAPLEKYGEMRFSLGYLCVK